MHYHLLSVAKRNTVLANVVYDNYPEALEDFSTLSVMLFEHLFPDGEMSIENAAKAMDHGLGMGALVGAHSLSLAMLTCPDDEDCEWVSPNWN